MTKFSMAIFLSLDDIIVTKGNKKVHITSLFLNGKNCRFSINNVTRLIENCAQKSNIKFLMY